jgi:hypothetical protein
MGMMSFVISLLVLFSYGRKIISNVSHIITMITLIRGEIFFSSLTLLKFLESPCASRKKPLYLHQGSECRQIDQPFKIQLILYTTPNIPKII